MCTEKKTNRRVESLNYIHKMCGCWKSKYESPDIRIYLKESDYYIAFRYKIGEEICVPITRYFARYEFELFGRVELVYDEYNDKLLIAEEGVYFRDYSFDY